MVINKKCTECNEVKHIYLFNIHKKMTSGYRNQCKSCVSIVRKNHYLKNRERNIVKCREWQVNNKEKAKSYQDKHRSTNLYKENKRIYEAENKEKRLYQKRMLHINRMKNDSLYNCRIRTKDAIRDGVKRGGFTKKSRAFEILGCEYDFFKNYIEAQFKKGMAWSNIHLDHIKPISSGTTEKEIIALNHYTNFQPLFEKDNLSKGASLIEKQLRLL